MKNPAEVHELGPGGLAALSICESLLIALTEKGLLKADEAYFVLEDAVMAHRNAIQERRAVALHEAAVKLIELIMANSNSIRGASLLGNSDDDDAALDQTRDRP